MNTITTKIADVTGNIVKSIHSNFNWPRVIRPIARLTSREIYRYDIAISVMLDKKNNEVFR